MTTFKNGDLVIYKDRKGNEFKTRVWTSSKKRVLIENWRTGDDEFGNPYPVASYVKPENLKLETKNNS